MQKIMHIMLLAAMLVPNGSQIPATHKEADGLCPKELAKEFLPWAEQSYSKNKRS